jgi:hypothetical protein
MFNFAARQFFEGEAADREVPKVDLGMQAPQVQMQQPPAPPVQPPSQPQQPAQ